MRSPGCCSRPARRRRGARSGATSRALTRVGHSHTKLLREREGIFSSAFYDFSDGFFVAATPGEAERIAARVIGIEPSALPGPEDPRSLPAKGDLQPYAGRMAERHASDGDAAYWRRLAKASAGLAPATPPANSLAEVFARMDAIRAQLGPLAAAGLPADDERACAEAREIRQRFLRAARRGK